jgi:hypothetical protein
MKWIATHPLTSPINGMAVSDLDRDGIPELVYCTNDKLEILSLPRLELVKNYDEGYSTLTTADVDGDGVVEIIGAKVPPTNLLGIGDPRSFHYEPEKVVLLKMTQGSILEEGSFLTSLRWNGRTQFFRFNDSEYYGKIISDIEPPGSPKPEFPVWKYCGHELYGLQMLSAGDLDGDGKSEILLMWHSTVEERYSPRVLGCFDAINKKFLWHRSFAIQPNGASAADINGDGQNEILLRTYAPGNWLYAVGGTDVFFGTAFLLDRFGNILRSYFLPGDYQGTEFFLFKRRNSRVPRVYLWGLYISDMVSQSGNVYFVRSGILYEIDKSTLQEKRILACRDVWSKPIVVDFKSTPGLEFVVGSNAKLVIYNEKGEIMRSRALATGDYDKKVVIPFLVADVNGDNRYEILVMVAQYNIRKQNLRESFAEDEQDTFYCFDEELNLLDSMEQSGRVGVTPVFVKDQIYLLFCKQGECFAVYGQNSS